MYIFKVHPLESIGVKKFWWSPLELVIWWSWWSPYRKKTSTKAPVPRAQTSTTPAAVERSRLSKRDVHGGRQFSTTRSKSHVRRSNSSWHPAHAWSQPSNVSDQNGNWPRDWATPHHQQADPAVRAGQWGRGRKGAPEGGGPRRTAGPGRRRGRGEGGSSGRRRQRNGKFSEP